MEPIEVSDVDLAFPANVRHLMPSALYETKPDPRWEKFANTWFFKGADATKLKPKKGVDKTKALRHLTCIMSSYQPKHEDKTPQLPTY